MEEKIQPIRYSDLEKQALIEQWKQSGKNKITFCKERCLSYFSFNDWLKRRNGKVGKQKPSFVPLKIKTPPETNFATLTLKNGTTVNLHQRVESSYLVTLLKL